MSEKESLTLWQSVARAASVEPETTPQQPLVISESAKAEITDAFNSGVSDDLLKAFRTPVDSESLAKGVC